MDHVFFQMFLKSKNILYRCEKIPLRLAMIRETLKLWENYTAPDRTIVEAPPRPQSLFKSMNSWVFFGLGGYELRNVQAAKGDRLMHIYDYAWKYKHSIAHTYPRTHARMHVRTHARTHVRTYVRTHVRAYVRSYLCTYVRTYVRA